MTRSKPVSYLPSLSFFVLLYVMNIFVTGAAGFIGSHFCEKLIHLGHQVTGFDNFDPFYNEKIKLNNLANLNQTKSFNFVKGSLLDPVALSEALDNKFDCVIHLAASAGVRPSIISPLDYVDNNVKGTVNLLEKMKEKNILKFIFSSSSSVYGNSPNVPFKESDKLDYAISPYATTKLCGENFTRLYHNLYQFSVINLRFFTVYGPRQRPDLAIHKFIKANLNQEPIQIFGDGSMARDYTYIEDTVDGISRALSFISENKTIYKTYNLGNSNPIALKELISQIESLTKKSFNLSYSPIPKGDVNITFADIGLAKSELGYSPSTPLRIGLEKFLDWFIKNREILGIKS